MDLLHFWKTQGVDVLGRTVGRVESQTRNLQDGIRICPHTGWMD